MRYFITLFLGYLVAAPLTTRVSLDLTQTDWTHLATYAWILFGWFVWLFIFLIGWVLWAAWITR